MNWVREAAFSWREHTVLAKAIMLPNRATMLPLWIASMTSVSNVLVRGSEVAQPHLDISSVTQTVVHRWRRLLWAFGHGRLSP